jgi:hypothetical protein
VRAVQPLRPRGAGESRILARGRPDERGVRADIEPERLNDRCPRAS